MDLSLDQRQLCDIQGRLFENSVKAGLDSQDFIKSFMTSSMASHLDDKYDRLQWMGEEYLLDELDDEVGGFKKNGSLYDPEMMYWTGYLYRYWHYLTGEVSKDIYRQADAETMNTSWIGFHALDPEMAVERFKEMF
ncbi:hypothetical protein [Faecalibaculum rodentium]|jgi:hypothetical protein|uniref:hypothetical protein n=1 Tax=Faecalibaculum rodentium TaxID=1702221 RepID=UPI002493B6FE|nr:hypothetical protein [Faecalibaculum rodentium]